MKDAPILDYKMLAFKKYISDNGKVISSKITSVSFGKQKKLTREIKKQNFRFNLNGNYFTRKYN